MASQNFSYDELTKFTAVPRETYTKIQAFVDLIHKWQPKINLISGNTLGEIWQRHIIDSIQLLDHVPAEASLADIGSGAGLPGLVLAIMGLKNITLIESDKRKAIFLEEAARKTGVKVKVKAGRVESFDLDEYSIITARAFAPLATLLSLIAPSLNKDCRLLLLKGKNYRAEMEEARKNWTFEHEIFPSKTDDTGVILAVQNITKKGSL